jgi:hypothetical protein
MVDRPARWNPDLTGAYDRVAEPYGQQFFDELARKPFDRERLDRFAARLRGAAACATWAAAPVRSGGTWPSAVWTSTASISRRAWWRSPAA